MKRYPQFFIGGPLDGQDKQDRFPMHPEWMPIVCDASEETHEIHVAESVTPIAIVGWKWSYHAHTVRLGGMILLYWADDRLMSREVIKLRFWELILKPHEIKVPLTKKEVRT
jgi:hypothetical protein